MPKIKFVRLKRRGARRSQDYPRNGSDDATTLAIAGLVSWFDQHDIDAAFDLFDRALALSGSMSLRLLEPSAPWSIASSSLRAT
jgi:hypothetical protein